MALIRERRRVVGGSPAKPVYETIQVGIREDAATDEPCDRCHGTGRRLRGGRSMNCEEGFHSPTCVGNDDPAKCICFCHAPEGAT